MEINNGFGSDPKNPEKDLDEVIVPGNDDAGIDNPDEVEAPQKDDNVEEEIPDEVIVPEKDDNDAEDIPDEV